MNDAPEPNHRLQMLATSVTTKASTGSAVAAKPSESSPLHERNPIPVYTALLNQKKIVPSSATPYFAVEKHFLYVLMSAYLSAVPFDEEWYSRRYPDVQKGIQDGMITSGRNHYLRFGFFEHRQPFEIKVDEPWYLATYPDVKDAIAKKIYPSAQAHFDAVGYGEGRLPYTGFSLSQRKVTDG